MSNIEKIRQEIERRKKVYLTKNGFPKGTFGAIKIETYEGLLAFIDSLPDETCKDSLQVPETCKENQDSFTSDLEEAARLYAIPHYMRDVDVNYLEEYPYDKIAEAAFIVGAEWQANQLLKGFPLPEDTVLFQKGVEEGRRLEKDEHRLTWQDMAKIDAIILDVNNEFAVNYSKEISRQKFYEEVLKRYNKTKT